MTVSQSTHEAQGSTVELTRSDARCYSSLQFPSLPLLLSFQGKSVGGGSLFICGKRGDERGAAAQSALHCSISSSSSVERLAVCQSSLRLSGTRAADDEGSLDGRTRESTEQRFNLTACVCRLTSSADDQATDSLLSSRTSLATRTPPSLVSGGRRWLPIPSSLARGVRLLPCICFSFCFPFALLLFPCFSRAFLLQSGCHAAVKQRRASGGRELHSRRVTSREETSGARAERR